MKNTHTRSIAVTALFAAISTVLMFFSFGVPFVPSYLKIDFSDLPALLASFALGPVHGVAVSLIKNAVNVFFTTTGGIGEVSNFLLSALFVFPAGLIYKKNKTKKGALIGALVGLAVMTSMSVVTNTFLVYPVYTKLYGIDVIVNMASSIIKSVDSVFDIILIFNTPFTFVKGLLNTLLTFLLYKRLSPIIRTGKIR